MTSRFPAPTTAPQHPEQWNPAPPRGDTRAPGLHHLSPQHEKGPPTPSADRHETSRLVGAAVGAGIGGGLAIRGARIAGDKAIEAAERAEQRAAIAEHQHWLRQARYDAYQELLRIADLLTPNYPLPDAEFESLVDQLLRVADRIRIVGPEEVTVALDSLVDHALAGLREPSDNWMSSRANLFYEAYQHATETIRTVLETAP